MMELIPACGLSYLGVFMPKFVQRNLRASADDELVVESWVPDDSFVGYHHREWPRYKILILVLNIKPL